MNKLKDARQDEQYEREDEQKMKQTAAIKYVEKHNLGVEEVTGMLVGALAAKKKADYDVSVMWTEMFIGAIMQDKVFQPTFGVSLFSTALCHFRGMKDFWSEGAMFRNKEGPLFNDYFEVGEFTLPDYTRQYGVFAKKDFTYEASVIHEGEKTMEQYFKDTMQLTGYLVSDKNLKNIEWGIDDLTNITMDPAHGGLNSAIEIFENDTSWKSKLTYLVSHGGTLGTLINTAPKYMVKAEIQETTEKTLLKVDKRFKDFLKFLKNTAEKDFAEECIENVRYDKNNEPEEIESRLVYITPYEGASFVKGEQLFLDYECDDFNTGFNILDSRFKTKGDGDEICENIKRSDEGAKPYEKFKDWGITTVGIGNPDTLTKEQASKPAKRTRTQREKKTKSKNDKPSKRTKIDNSKKSVDGSDSSSSDASSD